MKKHKDKAIFVDIDGTLIKEVPDIHALDDVELLPFAGEGISMLNEDFLVIGITNKSSIEKGYTSKEQVDEILEHIKKEFLSLNARIDKIYYCPHVQESNCKCRKPKTQLIFDSMKDFKTIDLNKSWCIGDRTRDIELGRSLKSLGFEGIKSIGLETGYGLSDRKFSVTPDFYAKDFLEAAKIIKGSV